MANCYEPSSIRTCLNFVAIVIKSLEKRSNLKTYWRNQEVRDQRICLNLKIKGSDLQCETLQIGSRFDPFSKNKYFIIMETKFLMSFVAIITKSPFFVKKDQLKAYKV